MPHLVLDGGLDGELVAADLAGERVSRWDDDHTTIRLWPTVPVERTRPVQRWLAELAHRLQAVGAGAVRTTNIPDEVWGDLDLSVT